LNSRWSWPTAASSAACACRIVRPTGRGVEGESPRGRIALMQGVASGRLEPGPSVGAAPGPLPGLPGLRERLPGEGALWRTARRRARAARGARRAAAGIRHRASRPADPPAGPAGCDRNGARLPGVAALARGLAAWPAARRAACPQRAPRGRHEGSSGRTRHRARGEALLFTGCVGGAVDGRTPGRCAPRARGRRLAAAGAARTGLLRRHAPAWRPAPLERARAGARQSRGLSGRRAGDRLRQRLRRDAHGVRAARRRAGRSVCRPDPRPAELLADAGSRSGPCRVAAGSCCTCRARSATSPARRGDARLLARIARARGPRVAARLLWRRRRACAAQPGPGRRAARAAARGARRRSAGALRDQQHRLRAALRGGLGAPG
jgi:hypothetical protein